MFRFIINIISRSIGFSKTESKGTLVLIFIILVAVLCTQKSISLFKGQSTFEQDSSALEWINEVHASFELREEIKTKSKERFPEQIEKPKLYEKGKINKALPLINKSKVETLDINTATAEELQKVRGIGPTYSERIIKYRNLLGGFVDTTQLHEVYGLKGETIHKLLESFHISTSITPIDINADSIVVLARHPYISYDLARVIINYRKEHGDIQTPKDLTKIKAIDKLTFMRLKPYLE